MIKSRCFDFFDLRLVYSGLAVLFGIALFFFSSGCAVFNPYHSHFQCPETYKGKCVPVQTAYKESIEGRDLPPVCKKCQKQKKKKKKKKKKQTEQTAVPMPDPEKLYQRELFSKYVKLIKNPETPLVVPPDVGRVLILSYTGDNNILYSWRYVYFFLGQPRWILTSPVKPVKEGK